MKITPALAFVALHGLFHLTTQAQPVDTIYTRTESIACNVVEVGPQTISYSHLGEQVLNTIYRGAVEKIVFRNGRIQAFEEFKALKPVLHAGDYKNVVVATTEGDVKGLSRLGMVSSKARAATGWTGSMTVQNRALTKLQVEAAMLGANAILLTQQNTSRSIGNEPIAYSLQSGMAYIAKMPDTDEFRNKIGDKKTFNVSSRYWMGLNSAELSRSAATGKFELRSIDEKKDGEAYLIGTFKQLRTASGVGVDLYNVTRFRLVAFNDKQFTLHFVAANNMRHNIVLSFDN